MMQIRNLTILIYADTAALRDVACTAAADPRLNRCKIEIRDGGITEAAAWLKSHASPDVLILGDPADDAITARLEDLAHAVEPGCKVIVVGRRDSIGLYRQLMTQGLTDYLGGQVRAGELIEALTRLFSVEQSLPKGKVVVSLSTSGGAGGSTVAAFLAENFSARIGATILLDLDLAMGTAGLMMGADVREAVAGALSNPGLDSALLERTLVRDKGARILSTPGALRDGSGLNADAVDILVNVARTLSKVLTIDLPKGWSDSHERLLAAADEIVLVATPDLPSLRNTRMMLDRIMALRLEGSAPRLLLNKAGAAKAREYRGDDLREALGVRPAAIIPWDPDPLLGAVAAGKAVTEARGKAATALRNFTASVLPGRERATARATAFLPALKTLLVKSA